MWTEITLLFECYMWKHDHIVSLKLNIMAKKRSSSTKASVAADTQHDHRAISSSPGDEASDVGSIAVLMVLYTLQGIPMGLSSSVPFLLQGKVGYAEQATFSLVSWPFSLKLLWAPIVDSIFSESFGRRKSWLIPVQLLCSGLMIFGGPFVGTLLDMEVPDVHQLTAFFFALYFLMATQDIAVDGWALTMLSPKNVGYASTCNSIGQTLGYFIAYVGFLALNAPATCNAYLRSEPNLVTGLVTLPSFMTFWGYVMLATTVFVWICKTEQPHLDHNLTIRDTYHQMWTVMQLPSVLALTIVQLTCKMAFAATDSVSSLKLVEYGVQKEKLALLSPVLVPLGLLLPVLISNRMDKKRPLHLFLLAIPFRLVVGLLYATIVYLTPTVMTHTEDVHYYYYVLLLVAGACHEVSVDAMNGCGDSEAKFACESTGGVCSIVTDGYFVEVGVCTVVGVLWLALAYQHVDKLQKLPMTAWRVLKPHHKPKTN
ncbi:hypothetical protein DYB37_009725 [Aphanomyces astaci]|uniref:Acetyl-coenzyme A transporter 1 n=1 Tax=Aphanomyces astaci TaxID=112090 RepID=A0A418EHV1_APHAT|nr:hypothetical protein DYB37_009725 [Aphanomyces astaci]